MLIPHVAEHGVVLGSGGDRRGEELQAHLYKTALGIPLLPCETQNQTNQPDWLRVGGPHRVAAMEVRASTKSVLRGAPVPPHRPLISVKCHRVAGIRRREEQRA